MEFLGIPAIATTHAGVDQIGSGTRIAHDVSVYRNGLNGSAISFGSDCVVHTGVRLVVGDIGQCSTTGIRVGDRVHVNVGAYLSGEGGLIVGNDVLIGPQAKLLSAGHDIDSEHELIIEASLTHGIIRVGDGAWIGAGAIVLENVSIGRGAVVAAGAVVTKSVADFSVVAGVPAKHVRYRRSHAPQEEKNSLTEPVAANGWERLMRWIARRDGS